MYTPSPIISSQMVASSIPALRTRLDDASDMVRHTAAAALASLAPTSSLAAYHAARAVLQPHLLGDAAPDEDVAYGRGSRGGGIRDAVQVVLEAAHAAHPAALYFAVERSGLRLSDYPVALAGLSGGQWTDAEVEGLDVVLGDLLPARENTGAAEVETEGEVAAVTGRGEAVVVAARRLATARLDALSTETASAATEREVSKTDASEGGEEENENEELFVLD